MSTEIAKAEAEAAVRNVDDLTAMVGGMVIDSPDVCEAANELLADIRRAEKAVEEKRDSILKPANAVVKAIRDLFGPPLERFGVVKTALSQKILAYRQDLEWQRQEDLRKAETARLRDLAEAHQRQREAEEAAANATTEADVLAAAKVAAEAELDVQRTEMTLVQAVLPAAPAKGGHATLKQWEVKAENLVAFVQFALHCKTELGDDTYLSMLNLDIQQLKKLAKATDGKMKLPGIVFTKTEKLSARA